MAETTRPGTHAVILVVDRDDGATVVLRALLERRGHRVLTAASREAALRAFRENDVFLIVVDCESGGVDLVRAIRAFDPFVRVIVQATAPASRPSQDVLEQLDVQGCHDKADGASSLMTWIGVGLGAYRMIHTLRERERTYSELVANVSHELRTPLNIVAGYVGLLLESAFGELPSDATQPLRAIEAATRNLSDVVANFLEHTKLEAGCGELAEQAVDVHGLAGELERLGRLLLGEKRVTVSADLGDVPPVIVTDEVKLRTILRNLVGNAAKFTAEGAVVVRFATRDRWLEVAVADSGPGIRGEDIERIFEPFRQGDGSSTRQHGGIGLGLALSRKYARLLGGTLTVESVPGAGSTFTLLVPARRPAADPGIGARLAGEARATGA